MDDRTRALKDASLRIKIEVKKISSDLVDAQTFEAAVTRYWLIKYNVCLITR